MENASKALLIAASVLLGIMIISVGVALFYSFGGFSRNITTQIEEAQIEQFNSNFYKFYGFEENTNSPLRITAHDVVTIANFASKSNIENGYQNENGSQKSYKDNLGYVQVRVLNVTEHMEYWSEKEDLIVKFIKNNSYINDAGDTKYFYISNIINSKYSHKVICVEIKAL